MTDCQWSSSDKPRDWTCLRCGKTANGYATPPPRNCPKGEGVRVTPTPVDAAAWFTAYYAKQKLTSPPLADMLAKVERCRSAGCDKLQNDICTMQGVTDCKRRSIWFGNLTGAAACQHWLPV